MSSLTSAPAAGPAASASASNSGASPFPASHAHSVSLVLTILFFGLQRSAYRASPRSVRATRGARARVCRRLHWRARALRWGAVDICVCAFLFLFLFLSSLPVTLLSLPVLLCFVACHSSRSRSGSAFLRRHASVRLARKYASTRTRPQSFEPSGCRTAGVLAAGRVVWRKVERGGCFLAPRPTLRAPCAAGRSRPPRLARTPDEARCMQTCAPVRHWGVSMCMRVRGAWGVRLGAVAAVLVAVSRWRRGSLSAPCAHGARLPRVAGRRGLPTGAEGRAASPSGPPRLRRVAEASALRRAAGSSWRRDGTVGLGLEWSCEQCAGR
ncbi:hypothetical protein FB451DRAFT_626768 [Mycena latifolia]|nr:hypothetical protein FB451DRAFT_626768 [Mycena latifolia]